MELLLHKGLGQFCEVADQWQLSGCICYTQLQALLSFQNINPSWNKAAHLLCPPPIQAHRQGWTVLESKSYSHYYHYYQCSPVPPSTITNETISQHNCLPHQFQQTAHHARHTKLQPVCMLWGNTVLLSCCVADFPLILLHLICVLLHSHCNCMTQPRLVSLCWLLTASKKNLPNMVLVKLDCSTV